MHTGQTTWLEPATSTDTGVFKSWANREDGISHFGVKLTSISMVSLRTSCRMPNYHVQKQNQLKQSLK